MLNNTEMNACINNEIVEYNQYSENPTMKVRCEEIAMLQLF